MESKTRNAGGRLFQSELDPATLAIIQHGTMCTTYRGVPFFKSPFDIAIYLKLLWQLQPRTVIEVGTKFGGSALWFADMLSAQGLQGFRVITVDIDPQVKYSDSRITVLKGDAKALDNVFSGNVLQNLQHPFLVIEDSSHYYEETIAVLDYFHNHLQIDDYIVVEDGVVSQLPGKKFLKYQDGPNRAIADFLARHGNSYQIDTTLCDHYGFNVTYNPNGWLRRIHLESVD